MDKIEEEIVKAVREIAETKFPKEIINPDTKIIWIGGFVSGYLCRTTEEIINTNNLKTKN